MSSEQFYAELPVLEDFGTATDTAKHAELPEDWWVIVADILGSTRAIEEGRYKQVNSVGACIVAAVTNVNLDVPVPYVFGGDGATLAVPPSMVDGARRALLGAQELARESVGPLVAGAVDQSLPSLSARR